MIDLHSHILPGIDDGAPTLEVALEMARLAVGDGIRTMACTPHIYPGLYMNDAPGIAVARVALQRELDARGIALRLVSGADVHLVPGLLEGLRGGAIPTLHGSRYLLLEPPHHVAPPRFAESVRQLMMAGYVPVITHPERLSWIETHYKVFVELVDQGAWMQVTAGAVAGHFGERPRYWGEKFLGEGHTHILATDAHASSGRIPCLSQGRVVAERLLGADEARRLVQERPQAILDNLAPDACTPPPRSEAPRSWWQRLWPGRGEA